MELLVGGSVHHPHAAFANLADDAVSSRNQLTGVFHSLKVHDRAEPAASRRSVSTVRHPSKEAPRRSVSAVNDEKSRELSKNSDVYGAAQCKRSARQRQR